MRAIFLSLLWVWVALAGFPGLAGDYMPRPAGGGAAVEIETAAWVEADGVDATGTVGDPARPYLTMNEAYDDGARTFHLGSGTFNLSKAGAIDVNILGLGRTVSTISLIESTNFGQITVRDLGANTFTVTTIGTIPPTAAQETNGTTGCSVVLSNVVASEVNVSGGNGGASIGTAAGGNGGSNGTVNLDGCCFIGTLNCEPGDGGAGDATFPSGGAGGMTTIFIGTTTGGVTVISLNGQGGSVGADNGGGSGAGSEGVPIQINFSRISTAAIGAGDAFGICGSVTGTHCQISSLSMTDGAFAGTINGMFVGVDVIISGAPSVTAKLSYINGAPY
jgi:hypothetical protein